MKIIFTIITIIFASIVYSQEIDSSGFKDKVMVSKVVRVSDGDTIVVNIDTWHPIIGVEMPIRIAYIDTPEMDGKCLAEKELAKVAKNFTKEFLNNEAIVFLSDIKRDKYFRLLANVEVNGKSLGVELFKAGLAKRYDGGTKPDWCTNNK